MNPFKNKSLFTGLLITAAMIVIALFGPLLAPHDTSHKVKIEYFINDQGEGELIAPPVAPRSEFPFGTDTDGYDIMAKLFYGAKYTVFFSIGIALARVAIGGLIGLFLGYYGKKSAKGKHTFSFWNMLNGIPIFLIVWFILIGISMNPVASPLQLAIIMAVVLTIVGVPSIAATIKDKTLEIRERQFVLASLSLGAGAWRLIRSHLFPQLKESFLILFVNEIILTLTLFGQLAIFHIFVGGSIMTHDPVQYYTRTNEWAGLIGPARNNIYVYQWILFIPLGFYFLLIFGFYLISKGIEAAYQEKYAKVSQI